MQNLVSDAVAYAAEQLRDHSEAVFQAGIAIELQGRGAIVQTEVAVPVPFALSWSGAHVTVGHVRLDCVVTYEGETVALEVKRRATNCEPQLRKYIQSIDQTWGLVLVTPDGVQWIRTCNHDQPPL